MESKGGFNFDLGTGELTLRNAIVSCEKNRITWDPEEYNVSFIDLENGIVKLSKR